MKFVSMGMSWLNYGPTLSWSLIYIMNAYFTYDGAFKGFAFFFNGLIITIFLAALVLGFFNPLVSGLLNSAWPACFALLASMLASSLGSSISSRMLGPGYYTFLGVAIAQIVTWIVKRVYHAKLGIPARTLLGVLKAAKRSRLKKARGSEPI
ncbi:MAG: hypothetical protein GYA24_02130 [Candidatus Lokiarchaeota archaeon]|nr:hypothetical protein [Candidatus Lokiarchaeota archaeon]